MKKLVLDVDALELDSFAAPEAGDDDAGTVEAYATNQVKCTYFCTYACTGDNTLCG